MNTLDRLEELSGILDERYMTMAKARTIYQLFSRYKNPPKKVVEIGTYCGTGAILMAAMVEPWGGEVITIDKPWTGEPNKHFTKNADDWVNELGVKNVTIVRRKDGGQGWFKDYLKTRDQKERLDFVYIDGGHTWDNTANQFILAYAALRHGGWMCFDDVESKKWEDVRLIWDNVVLKSKIGKHARITNRLGFLMRYDYNDNLLP